MKAISIGYSTEDGALFNDQYEDLVEGLKKNFYYGAFVEQHGVLDLNNLDQRLEDMWKDNMQRFGQESDKAEWDNNVAQFKAAIQGKEGTLVGWSVEYDDNVMFVFDTTAEQIEALEAGEDDQFE